MGEILRCESVAHADCNAVVSGVIVLSSVGVISHWWKKNQTTNRILYKKNYYRVTYELYMEEDFFL